MKIVGYCRVSDDKRKSDGERFQDVSRQKDKINAFCKAMNWEEPSFFVDDALSAYKDDYQSRPQFVKMLNEIRANRIQRVIIEDLTRWSRRLDDGIKTLKEASEKATITSLAEGELDDTLPEGWFKIRLSFLMAEWASKIQSYKIKSGMEKAKSKLCPYCKIHHPGRHPKTCKCPKCLGEGINFQDSELKLSLNQEAKES